MSQDAPRGGRKGGGQGGGKGSGQGGRQGVRQGSGQGGGQGSSPRVAGGMKRLQSAESQRRHSQALRAQGRVIGFVPTMGAFHEGHLALLRKAREQCDAVVVSIFVNPLQFGPEEDLDRYPRDLARDLDRARELGVDVAFVPEVAEMYPDGFSTRVAVGVLGTRLCGAARPGHFDGVCTVVLKLLGIVQPQRLYLGEKDRQQLVILQRMISDLNIDVKIVPCATVREADGLAMSSRNVYLDAAERAVAPRLYEALRLAQRAILVGGVRDPEVIRAQMNAHILQDDPPIRMEYTALVDPETFLERSVLTGRTLIALAAAFRSARLIDNILIHVPGGQMAERFSTRRS